MNTLSPTFSGHRTIRSIIWSKILDSIESISLFEIFINIAVGAIAAGAAYAACHPDQAQDIARAINAWGNYAFPKTVFSFLIAFNLKKIYNLAIYLLQKHSKKVPAGETIESIPTVEILDHLFELWSFKRDDIEKKFGIPRNRFTELAQKLEDIGVLTRGENNSRILNTEYSRSDIAAILQNANRAGDLKRVSREIAPNSYSYEPTGRSIIDRVKSLLSPSPRFPLHKIGEE